MGGYTPTLSQAQRTPSQSDVWRAFLRQFECDLRVAEPGTVVSFDATHQTVQVQLAIAERIILDGKVTRQEIPPLPQVPIIPMRAGGWALTMPIRAGDACFVIFADKSIEDWWQSSDQVVNQIGSRRHDLNDAFAIMGPIRQSNRLSGYSTTSAQLRSEDGSVVIDLKPGQITLQAGVVETSAGLIVNGELGVLGPVYTNPGTGKTSLAITVAGVTQYVPVTIVPP